MPRSGPISLSLPAFSGVTRKLILANVAAFFALAILHWVAPGLADTLRYHLLLEPRAVLHGELWQLFTYSFINEGILGILFGMLTLWFVGSLLESSYGSHWLFELYATSVIGGALLASALSFTHLLGLRPDVGAVGAWAGIFGLLVAIAMLFGEQEFLLWFVLRIKAKYMVAIYILIAIAILLKQADSFGALLQLSRSSLRLSLRANSLRAAAWPSASASVTSASATATTAGNAAAPPASSRSTWASRTARSTSTKTAATSTPTNHAKTPTTNAG